MEKHNSLDNYFSVGLPDRSSEYTIKVSDQTVLGKSTMNRHYFHPLILDKGSKWNKGPLSL